MDLNGKRVTVVGLGNSGVNAATLAISLGAKVFATDCFDTPTLRAAAKGLEAKGAKVELGKHSEAFITGSDLVVVSPGVENSSPAILFAKKKKIPVIGEMELGYCFCKGPIIAITGTNGKSTVTSLIGKILKDAHKSAVVCGNIGNSLCGEIGRIKEDTWVVLEVSSAQLERVVQFKPRIAVILNITDDHMDRYSAFKEYFTEKLKIFANQGSGDTLVLNYDAENLRPLKDMAKSRTIFYSRLSGTGEAYSTTDMLLKGDHNIENVIVSAMIAEMVGVEPALIKKTIMGFKGLEHRFETVETIDGVEYVDDSKGTTVDSTRRALESCAKPVILIAGGKDKHSDYRAISGTVRAHVKALVLIGEAAAKISESLAPAVPVRMAKTMADAVYTARSLADAGDIVLLSPMCSSFDMFKDYKERGRIFKESVRRLKAAAAVKG